MINPFLLNETGLVFLKSHTEINKTHSFIQNLYAGNVIYIEAEDDKFCRRITGVGSSVDSWLSLLIGKSVVITCAGDHYSMMEPSRSPDIGKIIAVAAGIRFRSLFPLAGRSQLNASQKAAVSFFKNTGMRLCMIRKIGNIQFAL